MTTDEAEIVFRQMAKVLPEGVEAVVVFVVPKTENTAAMHCLATVDPEAAYAALGNILLRKLKGLSPPPEMLGREQ
jgi:hypothetical protein